MRWPPSNKSHFIRELEWHIQYRVPAELQPLSSFCTTVQWWWSLKPGIFVIFGQDQVTCEISLRLCTVVWGNFMSIVFIFKTYKSRQKRVWFASLLLALIRTMWWWHNKHIATDWEEETLKVILKEGESVWLQGTWVLHIQSFLSAQLTKQRLNTELREGQLEL